MAAPALVMLAPGSDDPSVAQVTHQLRKDLQEARPELAVHAAFLDHCPPSGPQVVSQLASRGHNEMVFVPLCLTQALSDCPNVDVVVQRVRATHQGAEFAVSKPIGPAASLLNVIDRRLRAALTEARALEVDGLVLLTEGTGDVRGNALIARRVRQWSHHHRVPCVTAVADGSGPTTAQAIASLRAQGRRHIAVGSFFLAPDPHFNDQIALARAAGAVAVAKPLGASPELIDLVLSRYAYASMQLLRFEGEDAALAV